VPIDPVPQSMAGWPHQVNIPLPDGAGMFVNLSIQSDGTATTEAMDATLQSLVDHLQEWPGRRPDANVTGQKYDTLLYAVTPTNPIPPPPDPEDPGLGEPVTTE
jgi:hypothetical protein